MIPYMVRTVRAKWLSVRPVPMTVTVETSIFEEAEYLPNIIQVLDSLPMKPETPWYDAQTACETAIRQQFRGGDVCAVLGQLL